MNNVLPQIFIAPRSGEHSTRNFKKTIEGGYKKNDLIEFLSAEDKKALDGVNTLMIWGNRPSLKSRWAKMRKGDWVLFYQNGYITYAGKLLYKTHNKTIADKLWGQTESGKGSYVSWEYVFFLTDLRPVKISYRAMAQLAGYKGATVQGFLPYSNTGTKNIISRFGSLEKFLDEPHGTKEDKIEAKKLENEEDEVDVVLPQFRAQERGGHLGAAVDFAGHDDTPVGAIILH